MTYLDSQRPLRIYIFPASKPYCTYSGSVSMYVPSGTVLPKILEITGVRLLDSQAQHTVRDPTDTKSCKIPYSSTLEMCFPTHH